MAQGLFERLLRSYSIYSVEVSSAGLQVLPGSRVSENSVKAAAELGCDISSHVPRQLTGEMLLNADMVFCMSRSHCDVIKTSLQRPGVFVLGQKGVYDPYGGDMHAYRRAASSIIGGFPQILELISDRAVFVRKMKESDIKDIAAIERSCFSMPWSENALLSELSNPNARFFTALIGSRVVGYVGSHTVC